MAHPHQAEEPSGAHGGPPDVDCGAAVEELYRYLDGELPPQDQHLIGRHLQNCIGCLSLFDFEQVLWRVVRLHLSDAHQISPPPTLVARITISMQAEARDLPVSPAPGARFLGPNLPDGGLNRPN